MNIDSKRSYISISSFYPEMARMYSELLISFSASRDEEMVPEWTWTAERKTTIEILVSHPLQCIHPDREFLPASEISQP